MITEVSPRPPFPHRRALPAGDHWLPCSAVWATGWPPGWSPGGGGDVGAFGVRVQPYLGRRGAGPDGPLTANGEWHRPTHPATASGGAVHDVPAGRPATDATRTKAGPTTGTAGHETAGEPR